MKAKKKRIEKEQSKSKEKENLKQQQQMQLWLLTHTDQSPGHQHAGIQRPQTTRLSSFSISLQPGIKGRERTRWAEVPRAVSGAS